MEFTEGKVVEVVGSGITSMRVKMIRRSRRTSNITVEAVEAHPPYVLGERLHVQLHELREVTKRPDELARDYERSREHVLRTLNDFVENARTAREEFARRITAPDGYEALVNEMKWGHGVEDDLQGAYAQRCLECVAQAGSLERGLSNFVQWANDELLRDAFTGTSTNAYSNAVDASRRKVLSNFARRMNDRLEWLVAARAEMEVL